MEDMIIKIVVMEDMVIKIADTEDMVIKIVDIAEDTPININPMHRLVSVYA